MKISELAERTGVSVHRLRRYEADGLIRAERRPSGYREFGEGAVREVIFVSMGRDLGFSLKELSEAIPRYRSGRLSFEQVIDAMRSRIAEVDALIAEQRALRQRLVSHIAWLRKQEKKVKALQARPATSPWPRTRKAHR